MSEVEIEENNYKMMNTWEVDYFPSNISLKERIKLLEKHSRLSEKPFPKSCCVEQTPMPFYEEAIVILFWFLFFAISMYGPLIIVYLIFTNIKVGISITAIAIAISMIPTPFIPSLCFGYLASLNLKYFSYRAIWKNTVPPGKPRIGVTPPHGLFPFGGILGIFAIPRFGGIYGRGAAANAILSVPIIGNFLRMIGCVDATRDTLKKYLLAGDSVGISSGGIAEIFETNSAAGTETIILKSRGGICKLALQNGVDLVPGYLFGNSKALNVWYDSWGIMQYLSRKLRVSLVFFSGRWGLPIPYRTALLAVFDRPIKVKKTPNPSREEVQALLDELEVKITALFDAHKASFGWEHVKLIIK